MLKIGSRGLLVRQLQTALLAAGFDPGKLDGEFGEATQAALIGYQRSSDLLADGAAGPRTLTRLGLTRTPDLPSVLDRVSVEMVQRMFPLTPAGNIRTYLPAVKTALEKANLVDEMMVLMALATIRAETEPFLPITEGVSKYNTPPGGAPFSLYDFRADLGNRGTGDGRMYCGRGFVQLTGRANYKTYGDAIGVDLVRFPDRANDPEIAAAVLCRFIADKERRIKEALIERDFRAARRLVNGGSHGLDRFIDAYEKGEAQLKKAQP